MIYEQGFYKLSLTQITNKLRISRSTIYEYFNSKEGLVEVIVDAITSRLNQTLDDILNNDNIKVREKFIALAKAQSENLNARSYRLYNDLKIHLPHVYKKFEAGRKKRESFGYRKLVEQGIREGIFAKKFDESFLLQLFLKMGQLTGDTDLLDHVSMNKNEAMETIINVFLDGTKKH